MAGKTKDKEQFWLHHGGGDFCRGRAMKRMWFRMWWKWEDGDGDIGSGGNAVAGCEIRTAKVNIKLSVNCCHRC